MTYYSNSGYYSGSYSQTPSTATKKSWTAFKEADLLTGHDKNIGHGDTFKMPSSPTVTLAALDSDSKLSGDNYEHATDSYQRASVNGQSLGSRDIYVEVVWNLVGSDGKTYRLAEIEIENYDAPGTGDDFFSFVGDVPPAGVMLTVKSCYEVSSLNYSDLSATPSKPPAPEPGELRGSVFMDNNDNSVEDSGDMRLSGVKVELLDTDGNVVATTTTNGSGNYFFKDLDAGQYAVRFPTTVDGKTLVEKDVGSNISIDSDAGANGVTDFVTVKAGRTTSQVDAGFEQATVAPGGLAGVVFMDNNDNSVEDSGDMRLSGVKVELLDSDGNVVATQNTNSNGVYRFRDVEPGEYSVRFPTTVDGKTLVDQDAGNNNGIDSDAGSNGVTAPVTVKAGRTVFNVDAGFEETAVELGGLAGVVFMDNNDNSVEDSGDMRISGVEVELLDSDGNVVATQNTNSNGVYRFRDLEPGQYSVRFPTTVDGKTLVDQDAGNNNGIDSDAGANGVTAPVTVNPGRTTFNVDAGFEATDANDASLAGRVFMDNNDNDQDDAGDMGVAGVTVTLSNGQTAVTDANGNYEFTGLAAGDYVVTFPTEVDGKILVDSNVGPDATDSDADEGTGQTGVISLDIGERSENNDAGIEDPNGSVLRGTVFMDNNDNDQNDAGDMAIAGVTVTLSNGDTTVTDADGNYEFTGLPAGDYVVAFPTEVDGKSLVDSNVGPDATDSDAGLNGTTGVISLGINDVSENNDAGFEVVDSGDASLAGRVFMDNNDNDQDDAGDMGVGGVTVTLSNGDTTVTDADGNYEFTGLAAGDYIVTFPTEIAGKILVDSNVGPDATDSDADQGTGDTGVITLGVGERSEDNDAGIEDPGTASIGNLVFLDNDGNGRFGRGDGRVADVTVELLNEAGEVVETDVTNARGQYLFNNLDAGIYSVRFIAPDGLEFTTEGSRRDDVSNNDSDADVDTGETSQFELSIGERERQIDAGLVEGDSNDASLAGRVFMDSDDDDQDNGEMGVAGVTVTLSNGDTAVTDADGNYEFTGLPAGDYVVTFPTEVDGKILVDSNVGPDATDSDADQGTGETGVITLGAGERSEDNDAGIEDPNGSVLRGTVFMDNNDNDQNDAGDMAIAGVTVTLSNGDTAVTDADGNYEFTGLPAGDYVVAFPTEVDGKSLVDGNVGPDATDSDAGLDGTTGIITLGINDVSENNDAGFEVVDGGTAALGDKVFLDENGNGQQDDGEAGVGGVTVTLLNDDGSVADTTETDAAGMYLFDNLNAGAYAVEFGSVDGFSFTGQDVGPDGSDSDADETTGVTGTINLDIGEVDLTVDAGIVADNAGPTAGDDAGKTCANEEIKIDVLGNDSDPDGDDLTITSVDGQAISNGETITTGSGVNVMLMDGALVFDGQEAFLSLDIGEEGTDVISYTVSDGNGGSASADVELTFCGSAETLEEICASLPSQITFQVIDENSPAGSSSDAFTMQLSDGDVRIDGLFEQAYCVSAFDPLIAADFGTDINAAPDFLANIYCAVESEVPDDILQTVGINGKTAQENLNEITFILNQDYGSQGFTDAEIQGAIWALTDGERLEGDGFDLDGGIFIADGAGDAAQAQLIIDDAITNGSDFEAGAGDIVGLVIDPDAAAEAAGFVQPFIVGVAYDDLDCIC